MNKVVDFVGVSQEEIGLDLRGVFQGAIRMSLELLLEEEVRNLVGAKKYERASSRNGHRNGSYLRGLLTSMGHIDVRVPRSRDGGSASGVIGRYKRRTEDMDEMMTEAYVQGVSQRRMQEVTSALMGESVSRSSVSRVAKRLGQSVEELQNQRLEQCFPYLYLDATFIKARWAKRVENVSVLVAYGVGEDGRRHLLGITIGAEESELSWSELLKQLNARGLSGVQLVISDAHGGIKAAVRHYLPEVRHQRCVVHLQKNVTGNVPRRLQERVSREVGNIFKAPSLKVAKERLKGWKTRWEEELPEAWSCLDNGFSAATQFYAFPKAHHRRIRTTNGLERLNREIKRRTKVVGVFPDRSSALRLVTAVAIRTTAVWGDRRYLNMDLSKEEQKEAA